MGEKNSCLLDKKLKSKNQIPHYHTSTSKKYNKEDTRLFDKKPLNLVEVLRMKTKRSMEYDL